MVNAQTVYSERVEEHRRSSFTFGNTNCGKHSTYQQDFCRNKIDSLPVGLNKPPPTAQVFPVNSSPSATSYQWLTTTRRDISDFGVPARRREYMQCNQHYKETLKCFHDDNVGRSLRHAAHPSSMKSTYQLDFRENRVQPPAILQQMNIIKTAPKLPESVGMKGLMSEARHSYQWPSAYKLDQLRFTLK